MFGRLRSFGFSDNEESEMNILQIIIFCLLGLASSLMIYNLLVSKERLVQFISVNVITSYAIVFICLLVILDDKLSSYLDIALIYALVGFVVSVAVMKYYRGDKC
jgi:multisubunit Na+/H+ antiporter MnhF subunit